MVDFYGTAAGARAYHAARGNDVPADWADDDELEIDLLVASEYLDGRYSGSFPGFKVGMRDQLREWPRNSAFDKYGYTISNTTIPRELENATYEVALRNRLQPGTLTVDYTPGKYKRVSIDGALSVEYASFASALDIQTKYTIVDQILTPILTGNGAVSDYSGAISRV